MASVWTASSWLITVPPHYSHSRKFATMTLDLVEEFSTAEDRIFLGKIARESLDHGLANKRRKACTNVFASNLSYHIPL